MRTAKREKEKPGELEMPIKVLANLLENGGADLRKGNFAVLPLSETPYQRNYYYYYSFETWNPNYSEKGIK